MDAQDRKQLEKFMRFLTLKVAHVVVQSRRGKKVTGMDSMDMVPEDDSVPPSSKAPKTEWFNLAIPDLPEVTSATKKVLNGEIVATLAKVFIIEILLHTEDGNEMVLELWTVKLNSATDPAMTSISTIYSRMESMLKCTLSLSRITPAYKISRAQHQQNYTTTYRVYTGPPKLDVLGSDYKRVNVSDLGLPYGTINISIYYRTKLTFSPITVHCAAETPIVPKNDHFANDPPRKDLNDAVSNVNLSKPLTAGAFVDTESIVALRTTLNQQMLPTPPLSWLLIEKMKSEKVSKKRSASESIAMERRPEEPQDAPASSSAPGGKTKAIKVPRDTADTKYNKMMQIPFADGSPLTELASFYQECLRARSSGGDFVESDAANSSTDSECLSDQLRLCEEAVPEFDNMVASMFSTASISETDN